MKPSTLTLPLDLGVLGEQEAEVTFRYHPSLSGTREDPPEPEHIEIEDITLAHPGYAHPITLLPFITDSSTLEEQVLERFLALAESAAAEAAIDRYEERRRYEQADEPY